MVFTSTETLTSLPVFKTRLRQGRREAKGRVGARVRRSRGEAVSAAIRRTEDDAVSRDAVALDARDSRGRGLTFNRSATPPAERRVYQVVGVGMVLPSTETLTSLPVFKTRLRQGRREAKGRVGARVRRSRGEAVSAGYGEPKTTL
jgi:hypothetical protein